MNLQTVNAVSSALGISRDRVRRAIANGHLEVMKLGNRNLIDLDTARRVLIGGMNIEALSAATGLSVTAIRRGIKEGWMPFEKPGKSYMFDLEKVKAVLEGRMEKRGDGA